MRVRLPFTKGNIRRVAAAALLAAGALALRRSVLQVFGLALGGAATAFCLSPLCVFYEKRLSRSSAALSAVLSACAAVAALAVLLLPAVLRELVQLGEMLPGSVGRIAEWVNGLSSWAEARLPGVALPEFPMEGVSGMLGGLVTGAMAFVGGAADAVSRLSMVLMLGYFFLKDRERLLLRLELMVPQAVRANAVRSGRAVARELRLYLGGQLMVAGAVGALAATGLAIIGMRAALVLGGMVGLLNMVPYFGPFIGGVPAALIALGDGAGRAALCVGVLAIVQQIDGAVLSPHVMGGLTGFSPAAVLLIIYAGGSVGGIVGMLIALPAMMAIRTVFRVFVQNRENI